MHLACDDVKPQGNAALRLHLLQATSRNGRGEKHNPDVYPVDVSCRCSREPVARSRWRQYRDSGV